MPGKEDEADTILATEEAYKLFSNTNKTESFSYKVSGSNEFKRRVGFSYTVIISSLNNFY